MRNGFLLGSVLLACVVSAPARAQEAQEETSASGSVSLSEAEGSASSSGDGDWMGQYTPEAGLFELGAFVGLIWMNDDHNLRNVADEHRTFKRPALEVGLRAGYFPLSFFGAELEGALGPGASAGDESATLWALRGQGVLQIPGLRITPFLVAGGGRLGAFTDAMGSDGDPAMHVGIGAKMALTRMLGVRLDLRDNLTGKNPDTRGSRGEIAHHPEVLLGVTLTLGRTEKETAPVPKDRDGDGFLDPDDKCPDVKGVAPDGCPDKDPDKDGILDPDDKCPDVKGVAPDGCPDKDPDKDGILDPDDKCPEVKGVPPDGCPEKDKDPDKDGILDPDDKCPTEPETKNGFEDDDGCPDQVPEAVQKFTGVIQGIEFDVNKATIRPKSFEILDQAVKVLTDYPKVRIEISGHTDSDGKRERNVELSKLRAESVKEYFVKKGIAPERIETRGAGPDEPIVDNSSKANKQKNRRTEFKLLQ